MIIQNKRLIIIFSTVSLMLLIPLIAMMFTDEVNWTTFDFLVAALLLLCTGLTIDFILRKVKLPIYRIILSVTILVIFLLIWAELAVGLFGTPLEGQ